MILNWNRSAFEFPKMSAQTWGLAELGSFGARLQGLKSTLTCRDLYNICNACGTVFRVLTN
jgi:hypothetical protein